MRYRDIITFLFFMICISFSGKISAQCNFNMVVNDIATEKNLAYSEVVFINLDDSTRTTVMADYTGNINVLLKKGNYAVTVSSASYETLTLDSIEVKNDVENLSLGLEADAKSLDAAEMVIMKNTSSKKFKKAPSTASGGRGGEIMMMDGISTGSGTEGYYRESYDIDVSGTYSESSYSWTPGEIGGGYDDGSGYTSLTGGEVNDFSKWTFWTDIVTETLREYEFRWKIRPAHRFCVQVNYNSGYPVVDATVTLLRNGKEVWRAKSDNTGKAEVWGQMFDKTESLSRDYKIEVTYKNKTETVKSPTEFADGINFVRLDAPCEASNIVDLAWVVDATGSMGDEIEALKSDLLAVMQKVAKGGKFEYRFGSVFYRDNGDDYVVKKEAFTNELDKFLPFISAQGANGGGDYPEAMDEAMEAAINQLEWTDNARARLMFLILDAPPHESESAMTKVEKYTKLAAQKGIRIIPVGCTGIDKSTEYLLRTIALATNSTYLFTTEHSGIGYGHIAPTTDSYDVEKFQDLLTRVIWSFTDIRTCSDQDLAINDSLPANDTTFVEGPADTLALIDSSLTLPEDSLGGTDSTASRDTSSNEPEPLKWKFYPNPTSGMVTVELIPGINELYLADMSGKLVRQWVVNGQERMILDISEFPNGMYFLGFYDQDVWVSGKLILIRN